MYKGTPTKIISRFFSGNLPGQKRDWHDIFKVLKEKNTILAKLSFRIEGEIESFPDKAKIKKFINIKPDLQEMLKELL